MRQKLTVFFLGCFRNKMTRSPPPQYKCILSQTFRGPEAENVDSNTDSSQGNPGSVSKESQVRGQWPSRTKLVSNYKYSFVTEMQGLVPTHWDRDQGISPHKEVRKVVVGSAFRMPLFLHCTFLFHPCLTSENSSPCDKEKIKWNEANFSTLTSAFLFSSF